MVPKAVWKVIHKLQANGYQAYPVGGAVRNILLSKKIADWDVTTDARPMQVISLFAHSIPTGIDHGTITVLVNRKPIEVTTYRGELGYSDGRHPDSVVYLDSLHEDLKRRDFTVNAMALDPATGRIIDPFNGFDDLNRGLIRAVGNPNHRFNEDGLRAMRAVRFACMLDFQIEPGTFKAIDNSLTVFRKVSVERIRAELLKILRSKYASRGIQLLRQSGLLKEIIPEIFCTIGMIQNRFHRYDVYDHTLVSLEKSRGDPIIKLAVLLHDLGKPQTIDGPAGEHTFFGHEKASAEITDNILKRMKFSNYDRYRVINLIKNHMFNYQPEWTDGAVRRLIRKIGIDNLRDLWVLRRADIWGRGRFIRPALANLKSLQNRVESILRQDAALKLTDLAIDGHEVMKTLGIGPGPEIGKILNQLLDKVLDEPSLNNRNSLRSILVEMES